MTPSLKSWRRAVPPASSAGRQERRFVAAWRAIVRQVSPANGKGALLTHSLGPLDAPFIQSAPDVPISLVASRSVLPEHCRLIGANDGSLRIRTAHPDELRNALLAIPSVGQITPSKFGLSLQMPSSCKGTLLTLCLIRFNSIGVSRYGAKPNDQRKLDCLFSDWSSHRSWPSSGTSPSAYDRVPLLALAAPMVMIDVWHAFDAILAHTAGSIGASSYVHATRLGIGVLFGHLGRLLRLELHSAGALPSPNLIVSGVKRSGLELNWDSLWSGWIDQTLITFGASSANCFSKELNDLEETLDAYEQAGRL